MSWNRETWGAHRHYVQPTNGPTRHAELSPRDAGFSWHLFEGSDRACVGGWAVTRAKAKREAHAAALARGWEPLS